MPVVPSAKKTGTTISEDIKQQICVKTKAFILIAQQSSKF
ncbi:16312_t:CDS:2 [Funneliformis mosseae]|uniref:16312_t:CDS:1 n=1 Tax=Funneliformis mosseae TaxID=27381 RepID=A0A9N9D5P3_FUNMO|nr:16312_t:CDS:2 [Funneliformis mosseae]